MILESCIFEHLAVDYPVVMDNATILALLTGKQTNQSLLFRILLLLRISLLSAYRIFLPSKLSFFRSACKVGC